MPYTAFLHRVRHLFGGSVRHLDQVAEALADGRLKQPAKPMTDQELARAIREFQSAPPSEDSLKRLGERWSDGKHGS